MFTTSIAAFVAAFLAADFALGDGDETSAMRALFVPSEDDLKLVELAKRVERAEPGMLLLFVLFCFVLFCFVRKQSVLSSASGVEE